MAINTSQITDRDISWVSRSLLIPDSANYETLAADGVNVFQQNNSKWYATQFNLWGLAATKYTDTTPGGNFWINPQPQSHLGADVPVPYFTDAGAVEDLYVRDPRFKLYDAMSVDYSEVIDDNEQVIFIRPGKPEYNSIVTFATGFYNSEMGRVARTGRTTGIVYSTAKYFGMAIALPFTLISSVMAAGRWAFNMPASKFFYLRPTTHLYWNAANIILNNIMVNEGMFIPTLSNEEYKALNAEDGNPEAVYRRSVELYSQMLPDIFLPSGGIDLYAYANRCTRLALKHHAELNAMVEESLDNDLETSQVMARHLAGLRQRILQAGDQITRVSSGMDDPSDPDKFIPSSLRIINEFNEGSDIFPNELESTDAEGNVVTVESLGDGNNAAASELKTTSRIRGKIDDDNAATTRSSIYSGASDEDSSWLSRLSKFGSKVWDAYGAERADGSAFIGLRVDFGGTNSESFSNSTRDSDLQSSFNSFSAGRRNEMATFGNFTVDNAFVNVIKDALGSAITGLADGVGASGLVALAGQAFVDIPKQWDNSSYTPSTMSYTIPLRAWAGDQITRLIDLHVPLSCILPLVLPHSTGAASYNMPFYMEVWHKGWAQSRLCIVRSCSITRGTGNIGWTQDRKPRGMDITLEFEDLSNIMHMPLINNASLNPFAALFGDENNFHDYLAVVAGLSMADQVYIRRRWGLRLNKTIANFQRFTSPHYYANMVNSGTLIGRMVNAVSREIGRP